MKKSIRNIILALILILILVGLDQWTKCLAVEHLKGQDPYVLIEGVLEFRYIINEGMAFSLLQQQQVLFYILTVIVLIVIGYLYLFRVPESVRFIPMNGVLILLAGGAVGNFIDRVRYQYVIDFIYVRLIDFPIFNVADCFVTVSCILLFVLILFFYKDEEIKEIL